MDLYVTILKHKTKENCYCTQRTWKIDVQQPWHGHAHNRAVDCLSRKGEYSYLFTYYVGPLALRTMMKPEQLERVCMEVLSWQTLSLDDLRPARPSFETNASHRSKQLCVGCLSAGSPGQWVWTFKRFSIAHFKTATAMLVTGGWRELHNEDLHNLYSSPSIIRMVKSRRMRWAVHVAWMGETRNAYRILVGKPEGNRQRRRPRHMWVDNIKMDLRDGMVWIGLIWLSIRTSGGLLWTR
jgi:hypothetical protein